MARALNPRWLAIGVVALSAGYALQLFSPLRLTGDSVEYLRLAAEIADEGRAGYGTFPPGYPFAVSVLDRFGLGCSAGLVGLNLAALLGGLASAFAVLRAELGLRRAEALGICCAASASYVFVKHATLPLSDVVFFGLSSSCLWLSCQVPRRRGILAGASLAAAGALAAAACAVRPIGMSLAAPLLWAVGSRFAARGAAEPSRALLGVAAAAGLLLAGAYAAGSSHCAAYFAQRFAKAVAYYASFVVGGPLQALRASAGYRLLEAGEIALNMPAAKMPPWMRPAVPLAGAVALACLCLGLGRCGRKLGPAGAYAAAYGAILLAWPFRDARFWLPVLPLFFAWARAGALLSGERLWVRRVQRVYAAAFFALGFAALGYSTRISLAGERFPDWYGDGTLRATYRAAQGLEDRRGPAVDRAALAVLERFRCGAGGAAPGL